MMALDQRRPAFGPAAEDVATTLPVHLCRILRDQEAQQARSVPNLDRLDERAVESSQYRYGDSPNTLLPAPPR